MVPQFGSSKAAELAFRGLRGGINLTQSMAGTHRKPDDSLGACASTEKGRQFRQMSTDLSEIFPMIFCIERVVTR